jgi:hypothetical protein
MGTKQAEFLFFFELRIMTRYANAACSMQTRHDLIVPIPLNLQF